MKGMIVKYNLEYQFKQLIDLHFRQLGLEPLQECVSPNRRDLTSEIWLLPLSWSHCHCHIKEAAMVT